MPTVGFWNLAATTSAAMVARFISENGIDIVVVAEQQFEDAELCVAYSGITARPLFPHPLGEPRVRYYSVFPPQQFNSKFDNRYIAIKEYRPAVGEPITIVAVHLPSKLYSKEADQAYEGTRLIRQIQEAEITVAHDRTVVLGDFNMNPFEPSMVSSEGLHAVMDRRIAERVSRQVNGEERNFFYNPMWKVMGDSSSAMLGTYYRPTGSYVHYYWHTFDQVLLRPSLLPMFSDESLKIVNIVGGSNLLRESLPGIETSISDHLPIVFNLDA